MSKKIDNTCILTYESNMVKHGLVIAVTPLDIPVTKLNVYRDKLVFEATTNTLIKGDLIL